MPTDDLPADADSPQAAGVNDPEAPLFEDELCHPSRCGGIVEHNVTIGIATDAQRVLVKEDLIENHPVALDD
jgi:hypothetical protein